MMAQSPASRNRKVSALVAAIEWIGLYEVEDPESTSGQYISTNVQVLFEQHKTAARVIEAANGEVPDDLIYAYEMLTRQLRSTTAQIKKENAK